MKKVQQSILGPPNGDCLAACVASLFELELEQVPNFGALDAWTYDEGTKQWSARETEGTPRWWRELGQFAKERGYWIQQMAYPPHEKWGMSKGPGSRILAIATVQSPRFDCYHCVVANMRTARVLWDPYPGAQSGRYLTHEEMQDWILFVKVMS